MCGFIAILNEKKLPLSIGHLLDKIEHRGPDDRGWMAADEDSIELGSADKILNASLILGHVRLSILDLTKSGWQPMQSIDERYTIIFNGEIYNYIELRNELKILGHSFNSESDTEVLLAALIEWGSAAVNRLRGMFAFVFYDHQADKLLIARDFFGIKPLFWCRWDGGFAFASEVEPLLMLSGVSRENDPQATYEYLLIGASDYGTQSIYRDLHHLPAACYAQLSVKQSAVDDINPIRYWSIDLNNKIKPNFNDAVAKVRELFLRSVALHMRSDVPIGAALSGGVDSSAIVCAMRYLFPTQEIHTFSFIAEGEDLSEERWVDVVNAHVGSVAHKIYASQKELFQDLNDLIQTQGEPFGSTSIYAQYKVFERVHEVGIKVVMDGQGADEMLAGYLSYQGSRLASLLSSGSFFRAYKFLRASSSWPGRSKLLLCFMAGNELLPDILRWIVRRFISKGVPPKWISADWLRNNGINPRPDLLAGTSGRDRLRSRLLDSLNKTSIPHLLRYEDRNSMRFSVESRVPFLDVELAEYLYSLPEEYLISEDGCSKYVFREAMRGIVPDVVLDRRDKIGFATPEKTWLLQMNAWAEEQLALADQVGCFNVPILKQEWRNVMSGSIPFNFKCWRWLNFLAWDKLNSGSSK
jgi:asparagine synthase (glutamine-hydrolysing)